MLDKSKVVFLDTGLETINESFEISVSLAGGTMEVASSFPVKAVPNSLCLGCLGNVNLEVPTLPDKVCY